MKILYIPVFIILSVIFSLSLFSQEKYAEWKFIDPGFDESFHCASEDSSGNLWFGSEHGPVIYDGSKFEKFDYPPYRVFSILTDTSGMVWIGTLIGLYVFDGDTIHHIENEYFHPRVAIEKIVMDKDGSLWFATWDGLRHYKNYEWQEYTGQVWEDLFRSDCYGLFVDSEGNKWVGLNSLYTGSPLIKYDNESWRCFTTESQEVPRAVPICFLEDSEKNIWMCCTGHEWGIYKFDGQKFKKENLLGFKVSFQVRGCAIDREGYLWFVSDNGIALYDYGVWKHFSQIDSPIFNHSFHFVFVDSQGNRWFGGGSNWITLLTSGNVKYSITGIERKNDLNNNIYTELFVFPNPSNPQSTIKYIVPETGEISLKIYNILGQTVITLLSNAEKTPGEYSIDWDGKDSRGNTVPSGIYLCLYRYNDRRKVVKFTVLK